MIERNHINDLLENLKNSGLYNFPGDNSISAITKNRADLDVRFRLDNIWLDVRLNIKFFTKRYKNDMSQTGPCELLPYTDYICLIFQHKDVK